MAPAAADVFVATLVVVVLVLSSTSPVLPSLLLSSPGCGGPLSVSPHTGPARTDASVKRPTLGRLMR
jgi:hypothetical protein